MIRNLASIQLLGWSVFLLAPATLPAQVVRKDVLPTAPANRSLPNNFAPVVRAVPATTTTTTAPPQNNIANMANQMANNNPFNAGMQDPYAAFNPYAMPGGGMPYGGMPYGGMPYGGGYPVNPYGVNPYAYGNPYGNPYGYAPNMPGAPVGGFQSAYGMPTPYPAAGGGYPMVGPLGNPFTNLTNPLLNPQMLNPQVNPLANPFFAAILSGSPGAASMGGPNPMQHGTPGNGIFP